MKKKRRIKKNRTAMLSARTAGNDFVRGFLISALISGISRAEGGSALSRQAMLRHALQGGTALASATVTADAVQCNNYGTALFAAAGGVIGLYAIEKLLGEEMDIQPITEQA